MTWPSVAVFSVMDNACNKEQAKRPHDCREPFIAGYECGVGVENVVKDPRAIATNYSTHENGDNKKDTFEHGLRCALWQKTYTPIESYDGRVSPPSLKLDRGIIMCERKVAGPENLTATGPAESTGL